MSEAFMGVMAVTILFGVIITFTALGYIVFDMIWDGFKRRRKNAAWEKLDKVPARGFSGIVGTYTGPLPPMPASIYTPSQPLKKVVVRP